MGVSINDGIPKSSIYCDAIFPEKNHPAIKGPISGNPHI
jgi:hypothetical protein